LRQVITTIGNGVRFLGALVTSFWTNLKLGIITVWSVVLAIVSLIGSALYGIQDTLEGVQAYNSHNLTFAASAVQYVAFANTWVPISEALTFLVTYFLAVIGLTVYRFLKSWIPFFGS